MGRRRKRLKAKLRELEVRDLFRRQEVRDTDAALVEAEARLQKQKALAAALAERVAAQSELLARRAEGCGHDGTGEYVI